jgi:predicted enzyme related to lactoylglutathione lyase
MIKIGYITIDCKDPAVLIKFWQAVLGWTVSFVDDSGALLESPGKIYGVERYPPILFYKNPDKKIVKNRMHFDLSPDDQAVEVARIEALGGKRIEIGQSADPNTTWVVMADVEGNEFCVLKGTN